MADNAMIMVITRLRWESWPLCQKMPHKHYLLLNVSRSLGNSPRIFADKIKVFMIKSCSQWSIFMKQNMRFGLVEQFKVHEILVQLQLF